MIVYYFSLVFYVITIVGCVRCAPILWRIHQAPLLRFFIYLFLASTAAKCVWFIGLQLDWIINDMNAVVSTATSLNWLLFDYYNGIDSMSAVIALWIYLKWRQREAATHQLKRKTDRAEISDTLQG